MQAFPGIFHNLFINEGFKLNKLLFIHCMVRFYAFPKKERLLDMTSGSRKGGSAENTAAFTGISSSIFVSGMEKFLFSVFLCGQYGCFINISAA